MFLNIIHYGLPVVENDFLLRLGKPYLPLTPQFLQCGSGLYFKNGHYFRAVDPFLFGILSVCLNVFDHLSEKGIKSFFL